MLRFELRAVEEVAPQELNLSLAKSRKYFHKIRHYFFENKISQRRDEAEIKTFVNKNYPAIVVGWVHNPTETTRLPFSLNGKEEGFSLSELLKEHELTFVQDGVQVTVNYLLDWEIANVTPADLGLKVPQGKFSIAVLADTQGGDPATPNSHPTRMKIHNAFCEDSINRVNELDPQPVFTLVLGDVVDNQGEKEHFEAMHHYLQRIKSPLLYAVGNHETVYASKFSPGYYMEEFNNYFAAQKKVNGIELLLYSFDLGDWHFVVWPDPLRDNFFETHPHYFDWLEQDLEANREKPVMFFQHVPAHPIGIDPLINYAESVQVKRLLLDILSKHGNVKYIFSGHVHIPIKASFKTAVEYKGMKMINLPAAGYRPRAFGEEEWHGGPSQGLLVAEFEGKNADVFFKTVTEEIYRYPNKLPKFDEQAFPLWLTPKWQLPSGVDIRNGSFEEGLTNWAKRYVYQEDKDPSNKMEVKKVARTNSYSALYLYSRKRGYAIPGQDRLPQSINHLCQAVELNGDPGNLDISYALDPQSDLDGWAGAYVWLEGFSEGSKLLNMAYWVGKVFSGLSDRFSDNKEVRFQHFSLPLKGDTWQKASLNIASDFEGGQDGFLALDLDRLVINLGTWHINDGEPQPFGVYFDELAFSGLSTPSNVDGKSITASLDKDVWHLRKFEPFLHIAGEHRYHMATEGRVLL